jgi:hypothetical protein
MSVYGPPCPCVCATAGAPRPAPRMAGAFAGVIDAFPRELPAHRLGDATTPRSTSVLDTLLQATARDGNK